MNKRKIIPLTSEEIFDLYVNEDYTIPQLSDLCNCCGNIMKDILHATGLNTKEKKAYKKYQMNESCFDNIDNDVAYILGYFYTRVIVDNRLNTLRVQVIKEDENILGKICNNIFKIDPNFLITKMDGKEKLLIINNAIVKEKYLKLGYNKMVDGSIYNKIMDLEEELQRNFFRGYLEANVRIKFSLNRQYFSLVIDGDKDVINRFQEIIEDRFKINKYSLELIKNKKENIFYRYKTNKNRDIENIYKYFYNQNDSLLSDRHNEVFKDIFYNKLNMKLEK
ncbi:MAG: hypothetical protein RSE41_08435 [Clostridia bacterium]